MCSRRPNVLTALEAQTTAMDGAELSDDEDAQQTVMQTADRRGPDAAAAADSGASEVGIFEGRRPPKTAKSVEIKHVAKAIFREKGVAC